MVEAAGTSHWGEGIEPNVPRMCEIYAQEKIPHSLKTNGATGEVWNIHTGRVIGILQHGGYKFISYARRYAPLTNRHFDSIDSFKSSYDQIVHEPGD